MKKKRHNSFGFAHYIGLLLFSIYIIGVYHFTGVGTLYDGLFLFFNEMGLASLLYKF